MSIEKRKLVQKYLDKEMSGEEIKAFEEELKVNPDLYEELLFHKEVDSAIKELIEENMFLKNLEIAHDSYLKTMKKGGKTNIFSRKFAFMPEEDRPKTRPVVWYAAAAAATLIIGSAAFFAIQSGGDSPDRLYAEYKIPYEIGGVQRSGSNTTEDLYMTALALFEQKDYKACIANFDKLIAQGNVKPSVYYYKGLALLETDNAREAIKNLKIIAGNNQSELQQEAEWFLGLAYLKAEDVVNAKIQFAHIEKLYKYYKVKAREILDKLE
jgi:hypothetical protein